MGMSQDMKDTTAALEADSAVSEEVKACDPRRMGSWGKRAEQTGDKSDSQVASQRTWGFNQERYG